MKAAELARSAAERLVLGASLSACPLPEDLAQATGSWREHPVHLRAWAWRGDALAWVRLVTLEPGVDILPFSIGNLLAVGVPARGLPVLGLDVVHVRPQEVVVASDLVPTDGSPAQVSEQAPRWAQGHFSPQARVVRVSPEELPQEAPHIEAMMERYLSLLGQSTPPARPDEVEARQAEYLALHRSSDPGLRLLGVMFGEPWAERFLREVMFPELPHAEQGDRWWTNTSMPTRV